MKKRILSVLAGFLASAALLTGCGSGGESSTSGSAKPNINSKFANKMPINKMQ